MTVKNLIEILEKSDLNLRLVDDYMLDIEEVIEPVWVDSNYPYDKPEEVVIKID